MDDSPATPTPSFGESTAVSAPQFVYRELIGEGVSAKVYKAVDTTTDSPVAIKILSPHLKTDEISIERFRREIRITRHLNHPQVISIYDLARTTDGALALIMQYVPGHNLKDYLALHEPLPVDVVVDLTTQILQVLAVCHAKDVVHRDLKPQNVIVDPDRRVKLLDFGIARMTSLTDLTQTGTSLGSPEYMAPELFAANVFDPRTDLYAVGVMAYEMLAGELPFQGDSVAVLFHQHLNAPVPSLAAVRPDVPPWLDGVIARLLAKNAYERYQTADEALTDVAHQRVISKSVPEPRRRRCLRCSGETLAELRICTLCGFNALEAFAPGAYEVRLLPNEDRQKLGRFLRRLFRFDRPVPRRGGPLLVSGVDRLAAELLKANALEHGLYLTIRKKPAWRSELRILSSYLFAVSGLWSLTLLGGANQLSYYFDSPLSMLVAIVVLVTQLWLAYRFFRWTHQKPLLGAKHTGAWREIAVVAVLLLTLPLGRAPLRRIFLLVVEWLLPRMTMGALSTLGIVLSVAIPAGLGYLARRFEPLKRLLYGREAAEPPGEEGIALPPALTAEHRWVEELVPLLRDIGSEELRTFTSRLIEKYFLLAEHASGVSGDVRDRLKRLVRSAARVAGLLSELEDAIDDAKLAEWSRQVLAFQERAAAEPRAERREALGDQADAAAAKLRRFYDLETRHAALSRRLIHIRYAFDTLLGKSLVFHGDLGEPEAEELERSVAELERDLEVLKEVRRELRELA